MIRKILGYGVVLALAGALIFGTGYILLRPQGDTARAADAHEADAHEAGAYEADAQPRGDSEPQSAQTPLGTGYGATGGEAPANWETLQGVIAETEPELLLRTATGDVHLGMGPSFYWHDEAGFSAAIGDEVSVYGYHEGEEFKVGEIHNLTTSASVMLRDSTGRPGWSGRGNGQNASGEPGGRGQGNSYAPSAASPAAPLVMPDIADWDVAGDAAAPDCAICAFDMSTYTGPLTADEIVGLLEALNDEYYAWAVYEQVQLDFGQARPFRNIQNSERSHIRALERLLQTYQVPVPANSWPGNVPSFESVAAACEAGVTAEILNAAMYDHLFASTTRADILRIYERLQRASVEQHLPAFAACASTR